MSRFDLVREDVIHVLARRRRLARYEGQDWADFVLIAWDVKGSESTIRRVLHDLVASGIVETERRFGRTWWRFLLLEPSS